MVHSGERWCGHISKPNYEACLATEISRPTPIPDEKSDQQDGRIRPDLSSSSGADFEQPELKPYLDKYVRGSMESKLLIA